MTTKKCINYEEPATPSKKEQRRLNHPKADVIGRKWGTGIVKFILGSYKVVSFPFRMFKKASNPQIVWILRDGKTERQVYPKDLIDVKQAELGKWSIIGYIRLKKRAIPKSIEIQSGRDCLSPVTIIVPTKEGIANFKASIPRFNYGEGYLDSIVGQTPTDVMIHCQKAFDKSREYFLNAI